VFDQCDHSLSLTRVLWHLYTCLAWFPPDLRDNLLVDLFLKSGTRFFRWFFHWSFNLRSLFFDLVIFHLLHLAEHHTTPLPPNRQATTTLKREPLKREFSKSTAASTVDSVGQVSRLLQMRMDELQSLRETVECKTDVSQVNQIVRKVPQELRIYVQPRVFKQWDQAMAKY
jgi:hypothetical protein